ncbi:MULTISPECIES: iron chelate uptake ABC transporter family permease subunit [Ensifer]|jgi:iron complex transport system permease protein|uniref:ABC transporter permease n=1 Tax=Ensifer TaxID=106591 RepID=UPI00042F568B|nr:MULTISPECIES: iron chelate uptake ABC transporter family permease subunit [Ensifer]AHK42544.1 transmembrane permease component of heme ABC transporter [Ensifer adhaerens OV14]KQU82198.1 iron ABC transporter permease [Ensifer sp. Root31]KQW55512.1 iron ABC transporter permease [Ensifer sp. Root1252]KQW73639.1 iron ABC transporter permease [Ensifer sp. Root127]KQY69781.1 iron ABC transporter permease [Ensifer sp. Root142]
MKPLLIAVPVIFVLAVISVMTGVGSLASGLESDGRGWLLIVESRVPRTLALMLAGTGLAVAGTIMQMLARNRFVEPSTAGTAESAALGMLLTMIFAPTLPVAAKMGVAALTALAGTALFLKILRQIPLRSALMVPLVGIMLGGVISAVTTFVAYRYDMMQSMGAWMSGDFSGVLRGRYELLWIALVLTLIAYVTAARFTVIGMGEEIARNVGLDFNKVVTLGLGIVSMVTATVVATVGMVPFLGLIVPNIISLLVGDNLRRTLPLIAATGAGLVLACDIVGRIVIAPYEIPVGTVMGVVGSVVFLYLLLSRRAHAG